MSRRHTYTASVSFGGDEPTWEGEVTCGFSLRDQAEAIGWALVKLGGEIAAVAA